MHNLKVDILAIVHSPKENFKEYTFLSTDTMDGEYYFTNEYGVPEQRRPTRSFVRNFMGCLVGCFNNAIIAGDVKNTSGTNVSSATPYLDVQGPATDATEGLVVGTDNGTTLPLAATNNAMGAKIAHGTSAGQLAYGNTVIVPPAVSGSNYVLAVTRKFTNSTAGDITIQEVGMLSDVGGSNSTLVARDIGVGKTIAAGANSTLTYNTITSNTSGFTKNFLKILSSQYNANAAVNLVLIDGTTASPSSPSAALMMGSSYFTSIPKVGIVVGTGNGAENWDDYALGTYIEEGGDSGQLVQGFNATFPVTIAGSVTTSILKRWFFNDSGSTITINELGIYGYNTATAGKQVMFFRRLLSSPISLSTGSAVLISVTFSVTT